jgi:putative endopeptidase
VGDRFKERTRCVSRQYSGYEVQPGAKINGDLTLGENIADLGGIKLAFQAYRAMRKDAERVNAGGFNEDQQFFLAMGQAWCAKARPEVERLRLKTDPHSPPRYRVLGPLANLHEFAEAFSCTPPAPEQSCSVW